MVKPVAGFESTAHIAAKDARVPRTSLRTPKATASTAERAAMPAVNHVARQPRASPTALEMGIAMTIDAVSPPKTTDIAAGRCSSETMEAAITEAVGITEAAPSAIRILAAIACSQSCATPRPIAPTASRIREANKTVRRCQWPMRA